MIITDIDAKAALKAGSSQTPQPQQLPSSSSSAPPPAYEPAPPVLAPAPSPSLLLLSPDAPKVDLTKKTAFLRFFKAFLVASVVWLLITASVRSLIDFPFRKPPGGRPAWGDPVNPEIEDGLHPDLHNCEPDFWEVQRVPLADFNDMENDGQELLSVGSRQPITVPGNPKRVYHARYTLPTASAQELFLVARGNHSEGKFFFEPVSDTEEVVVEVKVFYCDDDALKSIKMCRLHRDKNAEGFGIFSPVERWDRISNDRRRLHFEVHVRVPVGASLSTLESYLPNFSQHFGLFAEDTYFDSLDIRGTNGEFYADALASHNIVFQTTNGKIGGHFETDTSITLNTTNGRIEADIDAQNDPAQHTTTSVSLFTTNGPILTALSLSTVRSGDRSYPGEGGSFSTYAGTTNGILNLKVPVTPLSPTIVVDGRTTNNRASLSIYRAFEGSFKLRSSDAASPRVESRIIDDPAHEDREPNLLISSLDNDFVEGLHWWGSKGCPPQDSLLSIACSNGPAVLKFT